MIKVENSYHNTKQFLDCNSIEEAKKRIGDSLSITAENLAENEVESDWRLYYETYEQAYDATFCDILKQLKSEVTYTKVN